MTTNARLLLLVIGLSCVGLLWAAPAKAEPAKPADMQEARWGFSTDLGLWTGTTNNTTLRYMRFPPASPDSTGHQRLSL